jgi:GNAT superfamily N-acetyltransferase
VAAGESEVVMVDAEVSIRPLRQPGDLGWSVMAHGEVYAAEFGWNTELEAEAARIVADYAGHHDPVREAAWIAELDGERVGCVFLVSKDADAAQLRLLLVDPCARGRQLGQALVDECVRFSRKVGYKRLVLWTNHPLATARRIYLAAGFRLIEEAPHHSFGVDLVGQTYELDLTSDSTSPARHDRVRG